MPTVISNSYPSQVFGIDTLPGVYQVKDFPDSYIIAGKHMSVEHSKTLMSDIVLNAFFVAKDGRFETLTTACIGYKISPCTITLQN